MTLTETGWLACDDPWRMLAYLEDKASARTFRLYHWAVLRQLWHSLEKHIHQAIEVTERHFDTANGSRRPAAKRRASKEEEEEQMGHFVEKFVILLLGRSPKSLPFFRRVFGNPFRPITISPAVLAWHDSTVFHLAQTAYDERSLPSGELDPARLAVLADALEETGCTNASILGHLREPRPHVRGCWVVDLLLAKE